MPFLGPPNRGNDPLHVIVMAVGLVAAAVAGALIGFALDFGSNRGAASSPAAQVADKQS